MVYEYSEFLAQVRQWAGQAQQQGWLQAQHSVVLSDESLAPGTLLVDKSGQQLPLVVAFMGGTGVGKSSLLNRLAGDVIARAGIERPTSKEVTLYFHQNLDQASIEQRLPTDEVTLASHANPDYAQVIWLDMPDVDSTETHNRDIVRQWLPFIDVLIYVVSPERYRDDKSWRLLLAEGHKHAWLFVMNHWDQGDAGQVNDFSRQLTEAGFKQPLIFTTSCAEIPPPDEFQSLAQKIQSLAKTQASQQIHRRNDRLRWRALGQALKRCIEATGETQDYRTVMSHWAERWQQLTENLEQGFAFPLQRLARHYADRDRPPKAETDLFWDDWAQTRFEDSLNLTLQELASLNLPVAPLKQRWQVPRSQVGKTVRDQLEFSARQALARPGSGWQRLLLKLMRFLELVLPVAAMIWVGYQAYVGFYQSGLTNQNYLGVDFAIHAGLLVVISWLLPFFLHKKLQPSLERSALRGLHQGLKQVLARLGAELELDIADIQTAHHQALASARELHRQLIEAERESQGAVDAQLTDMLLPLSENAS